jgi:nicotinate-nucleotide adenylyltransferase
MKYAEKKKIGLLFGSFNPIHNGHVALGQAALDAGLVNEVWYVVSPHNPDKPLGSLAPFEDRLEMVRRATVSNPDMQVCDIEDELPRPSYTFHTLRALRAEYIDYAFSIIAGDDILRSILAWEYGDEIVTYHDLIVRNRSNIPVDVPHGIRATFLPGVLELSATDVRGMISGNQKPTEVIPRAVHDYIEERGLYR